MAEQAQQADRAELDHGNEHPRLARPHPVGNAPQERRGHEVQQRHRRKIAHRIGAIAHGRAGQVQAKAQPDRQEDAETQPLDRTGQQHFRMLPDNREHRKDQTGISVPGCVCLCFFAFVHDPRQHERDRCHHRRCDEIDRSPAKVFADPAGPDARQQDAADHAGGQRRGDLPQPFRRHPFGRISRQEVRRDGREAQECGPGDKHPELCRQSHHDQPGQLSSREDGRQLAVRDPVAEWQQQQDAQRQRNLVQRWNKPDLGRRDSKVLCHKRNDRMDVVGVRRHHGPRQGQQDQVPPPEAMCLSSRLVPVTGWIRCHPGIPARRA